MGQMHPVTIKQDCGHGKTGGFSLESWPSEFVPCAGRGSSARLSGTEEETMRVTYAVKESFLGRLLLAATPKGICAILLGDSERDLLEALHRTFPQADVQPDCTVPRDQAGMLLDALDGRSCCPTLPLDLEGTPFQKRVWQELQRIPRGERISYGELARRIGRPTAVRAVARACAANPVAILIPCHRVVRQNGEMGGYRWGIERKRLLLEKEREQA
jgi:AraC family transcriptional regulator of adaptative response/methylated-DNA-[protein]-cysteine methyltransferase